MVLRAAAVAAALAAVVAELGLRRLGISHPVLRVVWYVLVLPGAPLGAVLAVDAVVGRRRTREAGVGVPLVSARL